ncbi:unnamed protein product [Peronospora farinosa]|uniref:Poly [ADP-ribose] polymerase n=1 Tax=Peronospora farinosa TaxID=134698 RepID=A0ABN8C1H4_9STRA|nr:unnamed protein product [Peronospora farinosa]
MTSTATIVDPKSHCSANAELYRDATGVRWSFMLNLTDISYGVYGNNKFYMGQLIVDHGVFVVFRKWGRVGAKSPQSQTERFDTLENAERAFQKVFQAKTGNKWPLTTPFIRKKGKYFLVELDDEEAERTMADVGKKVEVKKELVASKLPKEVQNMVQLICDPEVVTREMASLNVDLKRFPLGKLSKTQISQGYNILQRLSTTLEEIEELTRTPAVPAKAAKAGSKSRRKGKAKAKGPVAATNRSLSSIRGDLKALSSEFYSLIPHDFGRSLPPVIETMTDLKLKLELLEVLSNLEISQMLQKEEANKLTGPAVHPLDTHYNMLNTKMKPLSKRGKEFKIIEKFINKTNGGSKLSINTILKIARPEEDTHKDVLGSIDNHKLLWHGSRLSNFVGILSQGLRIAPPEAPRNGYQFGKGLYFADALAKSANYCCATSRNPTAVLLLADVALGTPYQIPTGEFLDYKMVKDQHGCDSTHGLGRMAPAENEFETLPDGVVVPAGTLKPVDGHQHLLYNEFIVYRREQVQLRYLDTDGIAWSFMLNYTNISFGTYGNNKFYMVQLIQNGADYMVFRKWGRVGTKNPQRALERYNTSLEKAQASFMKKFLDKSGNEWPLTEPFKRVEGKYVLVELDEEVQEEEKDEVMSEAEKEEEVASTLAETVQNVLKLICDANVIAREVASMNLDLKRLPLGKLSKTQIRQGYAILQQLSAAVKEIDELRKTAADSQETASERPVATRRSTRVKRTTNSHLVQLRRLNNSLKTLSSDFYTLIPHDFGRGLPTSIDSLDKVKLKIDLLEVLANLEISQELEAEKKKNAEKKVGAKSLKNT